MSLPRDMMSAEATVKARSGPTRFCGPRCSMLIRYYAALRPITGVDEETWLGPEKTLGALQNALGARYGSALRGWMCTGAASAPAAITLINGRDARALGGAEVSLQPEDVIDIFPPLAGG